MSFTRRDFLSITTGAFAGSACGCTPIDPEISIRQTETEIARLVGSAQNQPEKIPELQEFSKSIFGVKPLKIAKHLEIKLRPNLPFEKVGDLLVPMEETMGLVPISIEGITSPALILAIQDLQCHTTSLVFVFRFSQLFGYSLQTRLKLLGCSRVYRLWALTEADRYIACTYTNVGAYGHPSAWEHS